MQTERLVNLADRNPGAYSVLMQILQQFTEYNEIISYLERENIKGEDLWILYKDEHDCKIEAMADYILIESRTK